MINWKPKDVKVEPEAEQNLNIYFQRLTRALNEKHISKSQQKVILDDLIGLIQEYLEEERVRVVTYDVSLKLLDLLGPPSEYCEVAEESPAFEHTQTSAQEETKVINEQKKNQNLLLIPLPKYTEKTIELILVVRSYATKLIKFTYQTIMKVISQARNSNLNKKIQEYREERRKIFEEKRKQRIIFTKTEVEPPIESYHLLTCPSCGHIIDPDSSFCPQCGFQQVLVSPSKTSFGLAQWTRSHLLFLILLLPTYILTLTIGGYIAVLELFYLSFLSYPSIFWFYNMQSQIIYLLIFIAVFGIISSIATYYRLSRQKGNLSDFFLCGTLYVSLGANLLLFILEVIVYYFAYMNPDFNIIPSRIRFYIVILSLFLQWIPFIILILYQLLGKQMREITTITNLSGLSKFVIKVINLCLLFLCVPVIILIDTRISLQSFFYSAMYFLAFFVFLTFLLGILCVTPTVILGLKSLIQWIKRNALFLSLFLPAYTVMLCIYIDFVSNVWKRTFAFYLDFASMNFFDSYLDTIWIGGILVFGLISGIGVFYASHKNQLNRSGLFLSGLLYFLIGVVFLGDIGVKTNYYFDYSYINFDSFRLFVGLFALLSPIFIFILYQLLGYNEKRELKATDLPVESHFYIKILSFLLFIECIAITVIGFLMYFNIDQIFLFVGAIAFTCILLGILCLKSALTLSPNSEPLVLPAL